MNMKNHEFSERIPLYFSGRMNAEERAEFEAYSSAHGELERELDELRPAFEALNREFEAASQTGFELSPARYAELRRATDVNVLSFPAESDRPVAETGKAARRAIGRVSAWTAVAATLIMGIYLSQDATRPRAIDGTPPAQHIASDIEPLDAAPDQPSEPAYVYSPGYGLDKPDPWRFRAPRQSLALAQTEPEAQEVVELLDLFSPEPPWDSPYSGLDGRRPYYRFPSRPVWGAI